LPSIKDRTDRFLREADKGLHKLGQLFCPSDSENLRFIAATYSQDKEEVEFLGDVLADGGFLKIRKRPQYYPECQITLKGYAALDSITRKGKPSGDGFVAMYFDSSLDDAYNHGFQVGVERAGYNPVRIDNVEHINRIDDEIIARIKSSEFVVADFTGHRGGVYFEAGFALGQNLPVIWTCRKDDMEHLHFDIRQYNTIDWETPEDLAKRLQHRIEANIGKGPIGRS